MNTLNLRYFSLVAKKPAIPVEVTPEISAYMSAIARKKTPEQRAALASNAAKAAQANRKNPLDLPCTCGGGDSLTARDHKTTCPRGNLLYQRERAAARRAQRQAEQAAN